MNGDESTTIKAARATGRHVERHKIGWAGVVLAVLLQTPVGDELAELFGNADDGKAARIEAANTTQLLNVLEDRIDAADELVQWERARMNRTLRELERDSTITGAQREYINSGE